MQRMELCGRCVALIRDKYFVKLVDRPSNHKVTCQHCKRRRYGGVYDVAPQEKRDK